MSDEDRNSRMVSTRGVRYKFSEGERVLCYEPDPSKAKVLYDSKVLGIVEGKDKHGKKLIQYKIHFQGWNSSWDRRVNSDFVLKDTEENRQLQRNLAEKAQLQLAAYLYRREKRKRLRCSNNVRNRVSSEDRSSCSTFDKHDTDLMKDEYDSEASSIESGIDEDKVYLQVGEKLKQILEYDRDMIVNKNKKHILPAKVPALSVLENFVKQHALKLVFSIQTSNDNLRRRNSKQKRQIDFRKINNDVSLLKEFADGLRIYLDHTLKDHLLYKEEKEQGEFVLSEQNLKNFTYNASEKNIFDLQLAHTQLHVETESSDSLMIVNEILHATTNGRHNLRSNAMDTNVGFKAWKNIAPVVPTTVEVNESPSIRKECKHSFSKGPKYISKSFTESTLASNAVVIDSRCSTPLNGNVSLKTQIFLHNVFSWQIVPSSALADASMIYGPVHLARLTSKLPDFLNATHMPDGRLNNLIRLLDRFSKYLESHKEWYGEHNYK